MGIPVHVESQSSEFYNQVASGKVPGHSALHKFGRNPDIDGGFEDIWNGGGVYTGHNATAAETLEVFSSDGDDAGTLLSSGTATGGDATTLIDTGATFVSDGVAVGDVLINDARQSHGIISEIADTIATVRIMEDVTGLRNVSGDAYRIATQASTGTPVVKLHHMLDGAFAEATEYIIMNGVTPVDTVGTYMRQSRAKCHGGVNEGAITSRQKVTTANIMMVLPVGYGSTMIAAYTIPANKRGCFVYWYATLSKKQAAFSNIRLKYRPVGDSWQVLEEETVASTGTSYIGRDFKLPKDSYSPMSDIKIEADADGPNVGIAAGFDMIMVDQ